MAWAHDTMSLDELIQVSSAFLDILVLASGYQSSGKAVLWQPSGVGRALRWAGFLEQAMRGFPDTDQGRSSMEVLDMALADLMDVTPHPPGLPQLSCRLLATARHVLVSSLVQAFGIENGQVVSVVMAEPGGADLVEYLRVRGGSADPRNRSFDEFRLPDAIGEELLSRERAKSGLDLLGDGLDCVMRDISSRKVVKRRELSVDENAEACVCEKWCEEAIEYWTSAKTIYKLTGAMKIFEVKEELWRPVLDSLHKKPAMCTPQGDEVVEVAELCLLYLASAAWKFVLHKLLSSVISSSPGRETSSSQAHREITPQQRAVEQYFLELLRIRRALWWKQPPILAAAAVAAAADDKNSSLSKHYVESIAVHVHSKQSSGICFCHACCTRKQCDRCKNLVRERLWCALLLNRMPSESLDQLKRLSARSSTTVDQDTLTRLTLDP